MDGKKDLFVLVSLNMNYYKEKFKVIHKLEVDVLKKFFENISDKAIEEYKKKKYFDKFFFDIGYECNGDTVDKFKKIVREAPRQPVKIGDFINRILEKKSDDLYKELCKIFNESCHCLKKESMIKTFITNSIDKNHYDLIACQEVTPEENIKKLLVDETNIDFALDSGRKGNFYSDFLINKNRTKFICFETISNATNSLRDYIWKQVYYKYGFFYDNNCDKEFPTGYMSECYCEFNGTKIRVINIHRPKSSLVNNRFLPFTLFLISYLKAIQETYRDIGIILLGDFNGDENKECNKEFFKTLEYELNISEVKDKEKRDTHFDENGENGQKLDHVFVSSLIEDKFSPTLKVDGSVNLFAPERDMEKAFTDHSALILTLKPKPKSE